MTNINTKQFIEAWHNNGGSPTKVAQAIGINIRNVHSRRRALEAKGYVLPTGVVSYNLAQGAYKNRENLLIENGSVVVVSDRHKWPGDGITPAEAALHTLLPIIRPVAFVFNGDLFDGASISRHPPLGQSKTPTVLEELEACKDTIKRIEDRLPENCVKMRTVGNHDRRFDYHLVKAAPEYVGLRGTRLSDHFPNWTESWSIHVNENYPEGHAVIKHKHRQGVGAGRNNALSSGVSIVTGHTHALSCTAVEDYRGRRWGVECGFLSFPGHPAFEYTEDGPSYARPGFAVLTWRDYILQPPELVEVDNSGVVWFRGEPVAVEKPRFRVKALTSKIY